MAILNTLSQTALSHNYVTLDLHCDKSLCRTSNQQQLINEMNIDMYATDLNEI